VSRPVADQPAVIECCGRTDTGCVRKNNEDTYRVQPECHLYVLADGMGGAQAGEYASNLAADAVVQFMAAGEPAEGRLRQAFSFANRTVLDAAQANRELEGMGTTLVAALCQGAELEICSVGDSRAYACDSAGFRALTEDQSWVNEVGRLQLGLEAEALRHHPMRNVLTMAVGVSEPLRVNSYRYALESGALVLLCSDGLHGVVPVGEIEDILRRDLTIEAKCAALIERAKQRGGPDNVTVVVLVVG